MAIFTIGDTHLSFGCNKPMDIFGGWKDYTQKLSQNWLQKITHQDTVVLAGDISWGMTMEQAAADFIWLDKLPGKKLILKGNHDYWWGSLTSMKNKLAENNITTIDFIHNNSFLAEGINLCGSRGWLFETGQVHDQKIINREAARIRASLKSADKNYPSVLFLHYPPAFYDQEITVFIDIMHEFGIKRCYYGHIHGAGHKYAIDGNYKDISFRLIAADYINFNPVAVEITKKY